MQLSQQFLTYLSTVVVCTHLSPSPYPADSWAEVSQLPSYQNFTLNLKQKPQFQAIVMYKWIVNTFYLFNAPVIGDSKNSLNF